MKNIIITIFTLLIVATLGLYLVSFQVRETEICLVTTFGEPTRELTEPKLYYRWPAPIQRIYPPIWPMLRDLQEIPGTVQTGKSNSKPRAEQDWRVIPLSTCRATGMTGPSIMV